MKMTASWDIALCSLVENDRRFRTIALMMDAVNTSEVAVISTRLQGATSQNPSLNTHCRENLESNLIVTQPVKNFSAYGTQRFMAVLTKACFCILS
jgi:hypothetical protein